MFPRFVRFLTYLAAVVFAYFAYRLALVPFIEPAAKPRADAAEMAVAPEADTRTEQLQSLFPPGSWERDRPKVLDTDRAVLLLRHIRELDQYRLELTPCTAILFSGGGDDRQGARPVILQAAQGAVLTFDEPVNLARGQIGHLARGSLPGAVTIRSPESRPGAGDQLEVVTRNVQMTRDRIEAPQPIQFRYGQSYGSGRDLIIYLTTPAKIGPAGGGTQGKNRTPTVASAELVHVDRIRLQLDNPRELAPNANAQVDAQAASKSDSKSGVKTKIQAKPAPPSVQLEITCQGPFKFDLAGKVATFQDQVEVLRVPTDGALDQLSCHKLSLYFATSPGRAKSGDKERGSGTPDLQGLHVERVQALGSPAVLRAPSYLATLRAELFEYNFLTRQVRIEDRQKLLLHYQQYDVEAKQLEYQFAAGGGLGRLRSQGPGHAYGTLPAKAERPNEAGATFEATWNDRVILQPHQGDHALSLLGGGTLRVLGEGEFAARDLHLWIHESPDPQAPPGKPRFRYRPLRMLAEGDVRVDSWQLAGTTQRAETWIRYEDEPDQGPAAASPGAAQNPVQRDRRAGQKFDLSAEHLQTQLVRRGTETFVEHLIVDGNVRFREVRTEKAGEVPVAIVGDVVQVDHANAAFARVHVQGRPSEVSARGLTVVADTIQLNRGDNRIRIDSPGKMLLPLARRRGAGPAAATQSATARPLSVSWRGRMDFDGRTAKFQRDVNVRGSQPSPQGEIFDLLVMGHELAVTLNQEVNLSRDKPPQNLDVQELAFSGGVYLQNTGRLGGNQTSYDQMQVRDLTIDQSTGRLQAYGPGWGSSVRYDKGLTERSLNQAADASAAEPRLVYVRVDYEDEAVGNVLSRELEFRGRVRTLYGPVDTWDQTLDPNPVAGLGRGQYLLTSDKLAVADAAARMTNQEAGIELTALGNATIEGEAFSARAWRLAYARAKELVILEGDGRVDAELWRKGSTTPDAAAQQIRFWTKTQSVQVDGGRFLNLGQVAGPLTQPKNTTPFLDSR